MKHKGAIIREFTKTDAGRRDIAIPEYMARLLKRRRRVQLEERVCAGERWVEWKYDGVKRDLVFTQPDGQPLRQRHDTTLWYRLLDRAEIPRARRYTARHTAISALIAGGVDIATVADIGGHADGAFTMRTYVHAIDERKQAAAPSSSP